MKATAQRGNTQLDFGYAKALVQKRDLQEPRDFFVISSCILCIHRLDDRSPDERLSPYTSPLDSISMSTPSTPVVV